MRSISLYETARFYGGEKVLFFATIELLQNTLRQDVIQS